MKKWKKVFALGLAVVMCMAMGMTTMAAALSEGTKGGDKTITITSPSSAARDQKFTYTIYKVFDASTDGSGISYKLLSGASAAPTGFTVDDAGNVYLGTVSDTKPESGTYYEIKVNNATKYLTPQTTGLTDTQIAAVAAYNSKTEVGTIEITGAATEKTVTVPDYGYYYITTTSGTAVSIDSTKKNAEVTDKNALPTIDKKISAVADGTVAEGGESGTGTIGKVVTYEVTVKAQKGAENYIFHDQLSKGLTLNANSLEVTVGNTKVADNSNNTYYTVTKFQNDAENGKDDITLTFKPDYLKTITAETSITIKYTATINKDAVIAGEGNANKATLDYGHSATDSSKPGNTTPSDEPKVYVYSFDLVKTKADDTLLADAEFKLWADEAKTKQIKLVEVEKGSIYRIADATEETDATITTSSSKIVINGLSNGTYYLEETKAPDGYNKLNELKAVTISSSNNDATVENNTWKSGGAQVVNQAGAVLPSTGGIGTTMFYIVGAILVIGAGVVLISRRRMNVQ